MEQINEDEPVREPLSGAELAKHGPATDQHGAGGGVTSSIGSQRDTEGTYVAVYLTQHDVNRINLGAPVLLDATDDDGTTIWVHLRRERRRKPRRPSDDGDDGD